MNEELNELMEKMSYLEEEKKKTQKLIDRLTKEFEKSMASLHTELEILEQGKQGILNRIKDKDLIKIRLGDLKEELDKINYVKTTLSYRIKMEKNKKNNEVAMIKIRSGNKGPAVIFYMQFNEEDLLSNGRKIKDYLHLDSDEFLVLEDGIINDVILKCDYQEIEQLDNSLKKDVNLKFANKVKEAMMKCLKKR